MKKLVLQFVELVFSVFTRANDVISGKVVAVKSEYRNSYGEKFTRELVSAELK